MKDLKDKILESTQGKNIDKLGENKITIDDNLNGDSNTVNVNVKYFSKSKNNKQAIIVELKEDLYIDFFKNGNFSWEPLTYFEEEEDPQETWEDNEFDNCPEWFTKDKMPKSWDEVEKYIKLN